jgi:type VI secretion system secreted protein Hcp
MPGSIGTAQAIGGAVDYFLKIEGIEGESQDSKHKNEIQIESFSWGATQAVAVSTGGGHGAGKVSVSDLVVTKRIDKASAGLFKACATGAHIPKATLVCRKAGKDQQEFYKVTFTDILVSSIQQEGQTVGGTRHEEVLENVGLNFAKYEIEYKAQGKDGSLQGVSKSGYDVKQQIAS